MRSYTTEEFSKARAEGRMTSSGMLYSVHVAGAKTAGVIHYKEHHHTSSDTKAARRYIQGKFRLVEIETKCPPRGDAN